MARESSAQRLGDPEWFDPVVEKPGGPFLWDDGVHIIRLIERMPKGVSYTLNCGLMFLFSFPKAGLILEARIRIPEPTCPECISHGKHRTRRSARH